MQIVELLLFLIISIICGISGSQKGKASKPYQKGHIPTVFVLGVQKGGSSSLYTFLMLHPLLCGGEHKEPHYFDHDEFYRQGRPAYASMYTDMKCDNNDKAVYVDATPMMHYMHKVASRLADFYSPEERSKLKFIALLREPVARDYSWYQQVVRGELATKTKFRDILTYQEMDESKFQSGDHKVHRSGRYVEQFEHFTDYFRRDQILVINSGSIFQNSSAVMEIISKFLGIEMIPEWSGPFPHNDHLGYPAFQGSLECIVEHVPSLGCAFRDQLGKYYEPYNNLLYQWIKGSRGKAPDVEPPFSSFQNEYLKVPCVENARAEFNQRLNQQDISC